MTEISIEDNVEKVRFGKPTMLYIIKYEDKGGIKVAYRSYREFHLLYLYMKETYPSEYFPFFPQKKADSKFLKKEDISDRRTRFQKLLKFIVQRNLIDQKFLEFLDPNSSERDPLLTYTMSTTQP